MLSREEQQEYTGFIESQVRELSLSRRIRRKIRGMFVSTATMNDLRGNFIRDNEPRFTGYIKNLSGNDAFMTDLQVRYFERRIRTLPKDTLIRLSEELERIEHIRSPEVRERLLTQFCNSINLTYSLNGWFLHIFADELRKKQQP